MVNYSKKMRVHIYMCMCYHDDEFIMAVHVLFISDEWKCDPEFAQYLSELSAYSVEKLRELGSSTVLLVTVSQLSELQLSKSSVIRTPKILIFI